MWFDPTLGSSLTLCLTKQVLLFTMSQKLSFLEQIKAMKLTEFSFKSFTREMSSPDPENEDKRFSYLQFELETPIPKVTSSLTEYSRLSGKRVHDFKNDVISVRCSLDEIERYASEFTFDEDSEGKLTRSGKYAGDMFLDLSRSGEVWLTDTKLSKKSYDFKGKQRDSRIELMLKKYDDEEQKKRG